MRILKFLGIAAIVILFIAFVLVFCATYAVNIVAEEEFREAEEYKKELEGHD